VHKIAFELGPVTVTWYGIFVASGFMAGLWTASRRAVRRHIQPETIIDLGPWLLLGAIAGARAWFVISYWKEEFQGRQWYEMVMVQHGGLVYYGGLIGASVACIIFARLKKLPLWRLADVLAPSVALGSFFGRWGCLMNGCCYGAPTTLPWAIQFPKGNESYPYHVHPTQIYDSMLNLALYGFLAWLYRKRLFDGLVFGAYLILYALLRSFVELFRGDYLLTQYWHGMTPGQIVSVGIFIAGMVLLLKQWGTAPPPPPPPPTPPTPVAKSAVPDKA
jgi:phosphatidylglycerol---prolipoprotein diacylglyceryl transferase